MIVILDLGSETPIMSAGAGFLQDIGSWIWMPEALEIQVSTDGQEYKTIGTEENTTAEQDNTSGKLDDMEIDLSKPVTCRYIKFIAKGRGNIPEWHPGSGNPRWIFCDEIWVK